MALTPSTRSTREWPLLILTVAVVVAICLPVWQLLNPNDDVTFWSSWSGERWGRLLFGPEQIACYCCFTWACMILLSRYMEVRRQNRAFRMQLLPVDEGSRILHEDARPLQRRAEQVMQDKGPFILANMIRMALGKYIVGRSARDVAETVRTQAEVDQGRFVSSMATVQYLAWALPALGFLGTVRGLAGSLGKAGSLSMAEENDPAIANFLTDATNNLNVAFDTTLIALVLSLGVMYLVHTVQREEESLVIDCQQYCIEHLVNRLYEPENYGAEAGSNYAPELSSRPTNLASRGTRLTP